MNQCIETIQNYALRSIGIGERMLPRSDFTLCEQVVLIGSGLIWNVYFATLALFFGFFLAKALALAQLRWQEAQQEYARLMAKASRDAFSRFESRLASHEEPGQQISSARALFDLWVDFRKRIGGMKNVPA